MEHKDIPSLHMHRPHNWVVPDQEALQAIDIQPQDSGKYAWVEADKTEWVVEATNPPAWKKRVGDPGPKGDQGDPGPKGDQGDPGSDATVVAGTGLTKTGDTISVEFGTTPGTVAAGDDARLSDEREWTASVVTQAEAEAGTSSTARKWTAQRVRQAINAWWQIDASGFGRNFVQASNAAAARNSLELGTAATANVTTSSTDTTAGRLMKVGDFGLGITGIAGTIGDIDSSIVPSGFYRVTSGTSGERPAGAPVNGVVVVIRFNDLDCRQVYYGIGTSAAGKKVWVRHIAWNGTVSLPTPWEEFALTHSPAFTGTPSVPNLKFNNVASADLNTLDYYEEGTWTPTVEPTTTTGAIVYNNRVGAYTKIGDLVFWSAQIALAALGGAVGDFRIGGFPFIVRAGVAHSGGASVGYFSSLLTTDIVNIFGMHGVSTPSVVLHKIHTTGGATAKPLLMSNVSDNFQIRLSGVYKAA